MSNVFKAVSIIIPCHNCSGTVLKTWESLRNQTIDIDKLECIFVDDASTDDGKTWDVLQQIEAECPESVMIIRLEENLRQGGARNVAITYATGAYLMFLDSDDELIPDACKRAYECISRDGSDVVQFNHIYRLGDQTRITEESSRNEIFDIIDKTDRIRFLNATIVTYGCTNKIYSIDLIRKCNARFAEKAVYEEPLFVYPCFLYAERVTLITDALYIYNMHEGSTITSDIGRRLLDHPRVQLELLEYCIKRTDIYNEYRDVIGLYFLWSYYLETICFAADNQVSIPLEYFCGMQHVCRTFFSDWRDNPQVRIISENVYGALETIDEDVDSQDKLNGLIFAIAGSLG